jgi:hypothetical protein
MKERGGPRPEKVGPFKRVVDTLRAPGHRRLERSDAVLERQMAADHVITHASPDDLRVHTTGGYLEVNPQVEEAELTEDRLHAREILGSMSPRDRNHFLSAIEARHEAEAATEADVYIPPADRDEF